MTKQRKTKKFLQWPRGKTGQEIQDGLFKKMTAEEKITLSSKLAVFCLELNRIHGNYRPQKNSA